MSVRLGKDGAGYITRVHARANYLSRRAAGRRIGREQTLVSNVDAVWIIQSFTLPGPNPGLMDRVLVAAEAQEIHAGIIFNKMDLADAHTHGEVRTLQDRYAPLGYSIHCTSATTGAGMAAFRKALREKVNIFTGPSGVGKSTLLNALEPGLRLPVGAVSYKTRKGRHTTSNAELFLLTGGGGVVDTPGIREFGVLNLEPWELSHHFPEFRPHLTRCHFAACTHHHEPDCGVKEACGNRTIAKERYASYLNILHSIRTGKAHAGR